jgi:hypothetical protein
LSEASRDAQAFKAEATTLLGLMGRGVNALELDFSRLEQVANDVLKYRGALNSCTGYIRLRAEASAMGLGPFIKVLKNGWVPEGAERDTAWKAFCARFVYQAVSEDPRVLGITPASRAHKLKLLRGLYEAKLAGAVRHVKGIVRSRRLLDSLPRDEMQLIDKEYNKKRRHLPVRRLLASLPVSVRALTPCLLMSPQSVAQYLPVDCAPFDLVIFDEASQIQSADAVGALARGRKAVVVGDNKQLPPTDFFMKKVDTDDDEDEGDGKPLDSILQDCKNVGFPQVDLEWHYRSRHESLISFSNRRYYGGSLVTFPSADASGEAVSFVKVDCAVYDRGASRTNEVEAEAVVKDVVTLLRSPKALRDGFSVGVVTFNAPQQELIENILERERLKDPSLERFFDDTLDEPVIVKNLENIQGDERGYIYFSVGYGPDRTGKMNLNFGPLNKLGGERRLNVAITRARLGIKVFASFVPDAIPDDPKQPAGVTDLRDFMRYAASGGKYAGTGQGDGQDAWTGPSDFIAFVAEGLKRFGWEVDLALGDSRFRIDLAVKDPDDPARYLAGIECDGESFRNAATAVDREILRGEVLAGLGWNTIRIWSMEWWNQSGQGALNDRLNSLHRQLEAIRKQKHAV